MTTRSTEADADEPQHNQYLTFALGRETYALGILRIKEILEYTAPTEVPMMHACIRGVVNLRGAVVPVVDLSVRFGEESSPVTKKTCIVIVETTCNDESHVIGVVVDAVNEVLEIPDTEIEPPPSFGSSIRADFLSGMGKVRGRFVVILNESHVLSVEEMEEVAPSGALASLA